MTPVFEEIAAGFFVDSAYRDRLEQMGLTSMEAVFAFEGGDHLHKANLAAHRSRVRFELPGGPAAYLKRYTNVPKWIQLNNRLRHGGRTATCDLDRLPGEKLAEAGVRTPKVIAWGAERDGWFERRSFILTEEIPGGVSLEKQLPNCLENLHPARQVQERRDFLYRLADWVAAVHRTGLCHRDLYLSHIFMTGEGELVLIDLHRAFRPRITAGRYRLKDLTQLYYSAPGQTISRADRLRFYLRYAGQKKLTTADRRLIRKIKQKAWRMADHDIKHGRPVPFAE